MINATIKKESSIRQLGELIRPDKEKGLATMKTFDNDDQMICKR